MTIDLSWSACGSLWQRPRELAVTPKGYLVSFALHQFHVLN